MSTATPSPLAQIKSRFRSTVQWKPHEWQKPLDEMVHRICLASFLNAGEPHTDPLELSVDQFAILASGEAALRQSRIENDMTRYRLILKQYEEKAMEFLQRNRADRMAELAAVPPGPQNTS